ncbi:MAG: site-specific integrase, partial [Rhodocyclales bacterium]|nr:site-specific integrase [Rhodocyclales bacterium]
MSTTVSFPALLEGFFTQRLMQQRRASPHTIGSYRDSFRLLLHFAQAQLGKPPSQLAFEQIDAPLIAAFLNEMEDRRGIAARSRNLRLTAIRSFFRYAAFEAPAHAAQIQRVLAIPNQRFTRAQVGFLTRAEVEALLAAPDPRTWSGRRDHAMLLVAVQCGLRLSELTGVRRDAVILDRGAHIRVLGKGRKERATPLTRQTVAVLRAWLREIPDKTDAIVFPSARGTRLSADGVQYLLGKHVAVASKSYPSLRQRR